MATKKIRNFEDTIKVIKIALTLSGIDISSKPQNWIAKFFFRFGIFLELLCIHSVVMSEILWIIEGMQNGKTIIELAAVAPCAVGCFMITFKAFYIHFNGNILVVILNKFKSLHLKDKTLADPSLKIERKIVMQSQQLLHIVVRVLLSSTVIVLVAYMFLPIMTMILEYSQSGAFKLQFPLQIKYYFDPFPMTRYPFLYLYQVIATFFVCMHLLASETTYFALCTNLTMHFKMLSHRFKTTKYIEFKVIDKNILVDMIKRHHELIELCNKMEQLYSIPNLGHILLSSVLICLSGISVVFSDDFVVVFTFTFFMISTLSQMFFLCFFGDMIKDSSAEVGQAVYESLWYNADIKSKKTLLLVLTRARQPCKLTAAGFSDIDLLTFATILSRSWSYFALLQSMFE